MTAYPQLLDGMMDAILAAETAQAQTFIRDKKDFPPEAQLAVYVDGYRLRLAEVIESVYPALLYALGKEDFKKLAAEFIESTPSRTFNIDKYPIAFGEFVASLPPQGGGQEGGAISDNLAHNALTPPSPYGGGRFLQELAILESAIHDVYQREETPPMERDWSEKQTPESLAGSVFLPRAASRLLAFTYPVNDYLSAFRAAEKPTKPALAANYLLIFRHKHQVQRLLTSEAEYTLLSILAGGKTLDEALESERFAPYITAKDLSGDLMQWFARWVKEGCLRQPL